MADVEMKDSAVTVPELKKKQKNSLTTTTVSYKTC